MRYIRTKDGIYEVKNDFIVLKGQELYLPHFQDHIIAQADNIEKLCDEFICWMDNFGDPINAPLSENKRYEEIKRIILLGIKNKFNCWLKLGIWTDKGLIYKAKMRGVLPNGEIDWELL